MTTGRQVGAASLGIRRLVFVVLVAGLGLLVGLLAGVGHSGFPRSFHNGALALLAVGLYANTHGIRREELRAGVGTVVTAVTVGVVLKAVLIGMVIALVLQDARYAVLGIVVAQIDPLSVAAIQRSSRMTPRAKAILYAWASFDDPMTVLLTLYVAAGALGGSPNTIWAGGGLLADLRDLGLNLACAFAAWLVWLVVRRWPLVAALALIPLLLAGILVDTMLAIAIVGLFWRPRLNGLDVLIDRVVFVAFALATLLLGVLLAGGAGPADLGAGVVLGCAGFGAQILVGSIIGRRLPLVDRVYLALGQQNGITAIILALLLQPGFPRAVAIVAPAVLVVSLLYLLTNQRWERLIDRRRPTEDHSTLREVWGEFLR